MHADGGVEAPFFIGPESLLLGADGQELLTKQFYIVVNGKLEPDFQMLERSTITILGRSISLAIQAGTRAELRLTDSAAKRSSAQMRVAYIDAAFHHLGRGPFDPDYMRALFDLGLQQASRGVAFHDGMPPLGPPVPVADRANGTVGSATKPPLTLP